MSEPKTQERKFTKTQFLASNKWSGVDQDILAVKLDEKVSYTESEANQIIQKLKEKKVK
ncbi:hypothetical protein [Amphibacillus sediminis]|uniref:hypothetical protein n=1 Tax=Amphibacillus sediminis TaxID=360185 RepID=UPI0012EDCC57|nr:hypothetical protein [Amphibacillus sediminis]